MNRMAVGNGSFGASLRNLSEDELLEREFQATDPESLEGITESEPTDDAVPEVEFFYDMRGREDRVRCVYCKYRNHFRGVVIKHPDGKRRLVGRDCALARHGVTFGADLASFEYAVERQDYARRRRDFVDKVPLITQLLRDLEAHPALLEYDRLLAAWCELGPLPQRLKHIVNRQQTLSVSGAIRDREAELARKSRLGSRYSLEKAKARREGDEWKIKKTVERHFGYPLGASFFAQKPSVTTEVAKITSEILKQSVLLSNPDLMVRQIVQSFNRLRDLAQELDELIVRVEELQVAFAEESLTRAVDWYHAERDLRELEAAEASGRQPERMKPHYTCGDQTITFHGRKDKITLTVPSDYVTPSRQASSQLRAAVSLAPS